MKIKSLLFFILFYSLVQAQGKEEINSPNGRIRVTIETGENITWTIKHDNDAVIEASPISLTHEDGTKWGGNTKLRKKSTRSVDNIITSPLYKKREVWEKYNELTLEFNGNWALIFRVYDDGAAYRFRYTGRKPLQIKNEEVYFNFDKDYSAIVPYVNPRDTKSNTIEAQFFSSFENTYTHGKLSELDKERLMFLPLVVELNNNKKLLITEADLENYPGLYLNTNNHNNLSGIFAPYPRLTQQGGHNMLQQIVTERENFIAKVSGARDFPWRIAVIAEKDADLADCDMVYKLAAPSRIGDITWIKPGKVAWEWWNNWNIKGVDFVSGVNNDTYKFYIDFAAENGIEYVILDEGWAVRLKADMMQVVPTINIPELVEYAERQNVGLILWAGYEAFNRDMEKICRHYSEMGIKGFKVDFLDRDDQEMTEFVYRAAEICAKYNLILDMHGIYKPTGLQRTYPNVLNYEGVFGLEQMKWAPASTDQVTYDVTVPFIRMAAGPMDYTQGAMRNAAKGAYAPIYSKPMSQGTRCRQLAQYVIFESPLNMLCDNPCNYRDEKECLEFIANVPVVWDETRVLDGKIGEYIYMARRKGNVWYIGGLTNWTAREVTIDLSFLENQNYRAVMFYDGVNAHRNGEDYKAKAINLPSDKKLTIKMAPGGGFAGIIAK